MRFLGCVFALAIWAIPGAASAAFVYCPNPLIPDDDNIYGVDSDAGATAGGDAVCLDYGYGNIGQGGAPGGIPNDDFLNEDANGADGLPYSATPDWTLVGQFGGSQGGNTSGTYSFAGVAGFEYALGVKNGADPKWAVFGLPLGDYNGDWSITGGELSHLTLYRRGANGTGEGEGEGEGSELPEPVSLLLLGSGLGVAAFKARRRKKQQARA